MTREHIRPHVHESKIYFHFGDYGLSPYWALRSLVIHELDGYAKETVEIDGEPWVVRMNYSDSGIAPRSSDSIERDVLRDWELHLDGPGEAKAHYSIRARFDDMRGPDGKEKSIAWPGGEGLDIKAQASNLELERVLHLLREGIDAIADTVGFSINGNYMRRPLRTSTIPTVEYYVRLRRQYSMKLVRGDGVFYRIMHLLADEEGIEWVYKADNSQIVGYRHAFDLPPGAISQLGPDLNAGLRLKCYHPKYARSEETSDDPLSSPKYGVAFHNSIDGSSRPWDQRDDLRREIEDILINSLEWADIPTEPEPTTYVEDDHFTVEPSDVKVGRRSDPTPQLEAQQETVLLRVLGDLSPSGKDVVQELATDGGERHYRDLANATDTSVSTIYRVLEELNNVVKSDRGMVRFTSEKIRQEIVAMVDRLDELKQSTADRVAELANIDLRSRADSALEKWMARYGARLVTAGSNDEATLRFDTVLSKLRSIHEPHIESVLDEGLEAWTSTDRDASRFKQLRTEARMRHSTDVKGQSVGSIIGW